MPLLLLGPARRGRKSRKAAQTAVRRRWWLCCHPLQLPGRSHGLHGAFPAAQLLLQLLCGRVALPTAAAGAPAAGLCAVATAVTRRLWGQMVLVELLRMVQRDESQRLSLLCCSIV